MHSTIVSCVYTNLTVQQKYSSVKTTLIYSLHENDHYIECCGMYLLLFIRQSEIPSSFTACDIERVVFSRIVRVIPSFCDEGVSDASVESEPWN